MNTVNKLPNREDFVGEIYALLKEVEIKAGKNERGDNDKLWTEEILKKMSALSKRHGLEFWATGHGCNHEWLYDALFWINKEPSGIFCCVEIEWGLDDDHGAEGWDYQKILVARTDIPIFITKATDQETARKLIDNRLKLAKQFRGNPKPIIFIVTDDWIWHCSEKI